MRYLIEADEITEAIERYTEAKTLWLDTEVADYDTKSPRLSLIQILDDSTDIKGDSVVILDVLDRPELADEFIEKIAVNPSIEKVFHNATYDIQFLGKRRAKNVNCTLKMAQKIPYYLVPLRDRKLKTIAEQLCHFPTIDKSEQGGDWGQRPLTKKQLNYAKMDPVYVAAVHHRLLQISQLLEPLPETENINELTLRYRQIEHDWKQLDSEIEHLKDRLKSVMNYRNIPEIDGFKLSEQKRSTKQIDFNDLATIARATGIEVNFPIKLTKELQKKLADIIEKLPIEEETKTILSLKVKEIEDEEDLPF